MKEVERVGVVAKRRENAIQKSIGSAESKTGQGSGTLAEVSGRAKVEG